MQMMKYIFVPSAIISNINESEKEIPWRSYSW